MKVLQLVTSLETGGMEKLVCSLCSEAAKGNFHTFTLIVINNSYDKRLIEGLRKHNVEVMLYRRRPGHFVDLIWCLFRLRADIRRNKYDIIHVHLGLGAFLGCIASAGMTIPMVYTLHAVRLPVVTFAERICAAIATRHVSRFVAISAAVGESYRGVWDAGRMEIVANGINLEEFSPGHGSNAVPAIICIGGLRHGIKGQDVLLKALGRLKEQGVSFYCRLVGEGPSRFFLEQLALELNLREEVEFLGLRHDVQQLLAASDLLVLPSRSEGFGLVIIEAMACGVAVVASDSEGPREILLHGRNGYLFEPGNKNDLADKIDFLLHHPLLRKALAQQGRADVGRYSINATLSHYLGVYEKLIAAGCGRQKCRA